MIYRYSYYILVLYYILVNVLIFTTILVYEYTVLYSNFTFNQSKYSTVQRT